MPADVIEFVVRASVRCGRRPSLDERHHEPLHRHRDAPPAAPSPEVINRPRGRQHDGRSRDLWELAAAAPRAVLAVTDAVLGALREANVRGERAVRTWYAIYNYTLGFALNQAGIRRTGRAEPQPDPFAGIDAGAVPFAAEVAPFLGRFAADGLFAADDQYRFGLDLLLDSVRRSGR
jgi:hypothetical protein